MRSAVAISFAARVYSMPWRILAGALGALSRASLPLILVAVVLANDPPITTPALVILVTVFALIPGLSAWLIDASAAAKVEVSGGQLVVQRRGLRVEIPCASIAAVRPWVLPFPGAGFSLGMQSGRRLRYSFQVSDPTALLTTLADVGGVASARGAGGHPSVVYARAQRSRTQPRWYHLVGKFVVFALFPTALLFNLHQYIAYGGTLGEYYLLGLASYLRTFAVYWGTIAIYLVLFAGTWRIVAEVVALLATWVAPARAANVRRVAEIACRVLYYGGVPVLLALRFLA